MEERGLQFHDLLRKFRKLRGINIMEKYLGELWIFKLASLIGVAYLIYFFIKDRMRK